MSFLPSFSHPRFAGIDVNSGFEDYPGFKNFSKLNLLKSELSVDKDGFMEIWGAFIPEMLYITTSMSWSKII